MSSDFRSAKVWLRALHALLALFALTLLVACGDSLADNESDPQQLLPCDVAAVIERCASCHTDPPQFGAPMPLQRVDDFRAVGRDGESMQELVLQRVSDPVSPMPPAPAAHLTEAEITTLAAWFDAAMPARAAGATCEPTGAGGAPPMLSCDPDIVITKKQPYTVSSATVDETKCFGIELANAGPKRHIVALGPAVDNTSVVHHFLLFRAPTAQSEAPFDCALFPPEWDLLYAWAPGAPAHELPVEAGFPLEAGETSHLVLQMHYNNYAGGDDLVDDTAVELCTTADLRKHDAGVMSFGGVDFSLPPSASTTLTCDFSVPEAASPVMPVHIFQSWPHMHQFGRSMTTTLFKASGEEQTLVDAAFSFSSQLLYPTSVDLDVGDRMQTICRWDNTTPNTVSYGEASADEMCFNIVAYYPAITAPTFPGGLPAGLADCTTE